jgi:DNA-binding FrmR family transcriptional regulator
MRDTRPNQHEMLRRLHRTSGQLRAIAEHLDALVDQQLPPAAPGGPPAAPTA